MRNEDLWQDDQTPYDTLMELVAFANIADQHINQLIKNQKEMIAASNALKHDLDQLTLRLAGWEAVLVSMTEEYNAKKDS